MPAFRRVRRRPASEIEGRIRAALEELRPMLRLDGGIELLEFDPASGLARLRVDGGCPDCDMTAATLARGIEAHLRRAVPEVEAVAAEPGD